ncbi:WG repeat-containing protein [Enterococcus eurekensis]|uniref:WG repeat-containing protein n=1 Tax=Enterococcus eurekensis TaxID=1159753 RepID=A0ABV9M232_9ENTE
MDKQGQYVLEPKFSSIGEYNHGVLPVMIDLFEDEMIDSPLKPNQEDLTSTYGFINLDEEVVLSFGNENF